MRVLVTNTQKAQTYEIMRSLRPHAERIVSAMEEGWSGHADRSRHVDARYSVRRPKIPNNSSDEVSNRRGYLKDILDICRKERIDVVFPSRESDLYVLAQNRQLLDDAGVVLVSPEFETLLRALDKSETIRLAEGCGFPCPKTLMSPSEADIRAFARAVPPPWVIKPRISSGSAGIAIIRDQGDLVTAFKFVDERFPAPMIQELIPGMEKQNFYVFADAKSNVHYMLCPKIVRYNKRLYRNSTAACLSANDHPFRSQVENLVKELSWSGAITVQTKIDARDGVPKLMEANAGVRTKVWYKTALGVNDPLFNVLVAQGKTLPDFNDFENDVLFLEPIDDLANFVPEILDLVVFAFKSNVLKREPTDPNNVPPSFGRFFGSYLRDYFGPHRKIFSPEVRFMLDDLKPNSRYVWQRMRSSFWRVRYAGQ